MYPIPRIEDILDALESKPVRSSLDFKSGYHQIELTEESKPKTAFLAGGNAYEWNVLPFGLKNAPSAFQSYVNKMLEGLLFKTCCIYIDDLICFSETFDQHLKDLDEIMQRIEKHNMKLNPTKCQFLCKEFRFLGFIITENGSKPDPNKVKAINEMKPPKTIKEIRRFCGMCCFYRKYVHKYSLIMEPITNLLRKESRFNWNDECQKAFDEMKKRLTEAPVLGHYSKGQPLILYTDASNYGVAAILSQEVDGKEKVLQYASALLDKHQLNYTVSEKEMLAIVWSVDKFRHYLLGHKFKIVTDHHSLCYLLKLKSPSGRLSRWALKLAEYQFDIVYKSGKLHNNVDTLSRAPINEIIDSNVEDIPFCQIENIDLIKEQSDDKYCQFLDKVLQKGMKRFTAKYLKKGDIIYRKTFNSLGEEINLVVLPKSLKKDILFSMHDDLLAGHQGVTRTLYRIKTRYYWPRLDKSVRKYVNSCKTCQHRKLKIGKPDGLMKPIICLTPFEIVAIDILGPFPLSSNKKKYIIIMIDLYSRYLETEAVYDIKGKTVAKFFVERAVLRHGSPKRILSDNAQNFNAEFLNEVFNMLSTKHIRTTSYRPQCNGGAERVCRTITDMIACYVSTNQRDWSYFLKFLAFAYNSARNDSTGESPYFMLYNRNPRLPSDQYLNLDIQFIENTRDLQRIEDAKNLIKLNILDAKFKQKVSYDLKHKDSEYKVGDRVLLFTPTREIGLSKKLMSNYFGPKVIIRKLSSITYLVEDERTFKREKVHVERLKRFFDEDINLEDDDIWISEKESRDLGYAHDLPVKFRNVPEVEEKMRKT